MKKGLKIFKNILLILALAFIIGIITGMLMSVYYPENYAIGIWGFYIITFIAFVLHITIHELGHLIGGLLSGYKFNSYRVFNFMWVNIDGKIKFKMMSLSGTAGQCLMSLPDKEYDEIPYFLYNFMGGGLNIIFSLLALIILMIIGPNNFAAFLIMFFIIGITLALQNLIPLKVSGIANDGMNIKECRKSKEARNSLFRILKTSDLLASGLRVKDFPEEVLKTENESEKKDVLSAGIYTNYCMKFVDEHNYGTAVKIIDEFLKDNTAILPLHKNLLINDKIFCLIMLNETKEEIEKLLTKDFLNIQKAMKSQLGIIRTNYALNLCIYKDEKKASKQLEIFYKISKSHPYKGDIQMETELVEEARNFKYTAV